jgi:hypothetical protein
MRSHLIVLPLLLAACADDSFAVIELLAYSGTLDGVSQFRVHVTTASAEEVLLYPPQPTRSLHLDADRPVTFSVEFGAAHSGEATFEIEALSPQDTVLGYGKSSGTISKHTVSNVTVRVVPGAVRPEHPIDAGAPSDGQSQLACDPNAPAAACAAGQTCGILCTPDQPAIGMCYVGGTGNPGDPCASNNDCSPGSQCFTFAAADCNVTTCLKFCRDDLACGQADAYCNVPIKCGTTAPFSACSRPCDPAAGTGCAPGLSCFVYAGETTDCACPGQGAPGAACTQNSGCSGEPGCLGCGPGLSCVIPAGADAGTSMGICRPVCRLDSLACPSGTACHAFDNSSRRVYGFCQ